MIQQRAAEANKASLEAEKERDELHNQIEQIEEQMYPKRAHTHDAAGDAHEMLAEVENWNLRDHRQQATRVQNRRNVQVGSRQNQAKPRTGTVLHHTRLGLVGWIAYWCLGDSALAVDIIVALIKTLGLCCWCTACSRVRGRGHGSKSCGPNLMASWLMAHGLMVEGCTRTKLTFWTEDEFTVTASTRSTRVCVLGTVTAPSWLTCGFIEWMKMPQV